MKPFAFISRHAPTPDQYILAEEQDIVLNWVGDYDAFCVSPEWVAQQAAAVGLPDFVGVIVVHPAAAMNLCRYYQIGVFENANRAPIGEKPQFQAVRMEVFAL